MTTMNRTITLSPDVLAQEVSGEMVLLDIKSEQYLGLNEVGARVWQLLQEDGNLNNAYTTLLEEYDVAPKTLEQDINNLITEMERAGLCTTL